MRRFAGLEFIRGVQPARAQEQVPAARQMSDRRGRIGAVRSDTIIVTNPSNGEIVWEVPDMGAAEAASRYPVGGAMDDGSQGGRGRRRVGGWPQLSVTALKYE